MGDSIVVVALALFVTDLTGSATDVGIVLAAQMMPLVAFLLIGGVWADRLPRARLMISTDLVRMALHTLLAILIFTDEVEIWHLVVIEALFGSAEAFFRPAHTGLVPRTVPEPRSRRRRRSRTSRSTWPSWWARRSPPRSCSASAPAGRSCSTPPPSG